MRRKRESQEQTALIKWWRCSVPEKHAKNLIHIPNGGSRHAFEARNLKLQGVIAGVPDLFLSLPSKGKSGLWLEMKAPITSSYKNKPTSLQKEYMNLMEEVGYGVSVSYGFEEAREAITDYLTGGEFSFILRV